MKEWKMQGNTEAGAMERLVNWHNNNLPQRMDDMISANFKRYITPLTP